VDYFTSDTHFGHANVIGYSHRPFRDVEEMNRAMIERWNARVRPEDTVFHLGDFAMGPRERYAEYARALNGKKVLILGNHDRGAPFMREIGFHEVYRRQVYIPGGYIGGTLLRHHPQDDLDAKGFSLQLCGHVHEKWAQRRTPGGHRIINVGVDQHDYRPITFEEALRG
jgi:calcineurin-like phosphoesterase family protein